MAWVQMRLFMGCVLLVGCGFRSDPFTPPQQGSGDSSGTSAASEDTGSSADGDPVPRPTCDDPSPLAWEFGTYAGKIAPGGGEQFCGGAFGSGDVYALTAPQTGDGTLTLDTASAPGTQLQVALSLDGTCSNVELLACANPGEATTFSTVAGGTYLVDVADSRGSAADYTFSFNPQAFEQCPLHTEVITQLSGGTFRWENDLPSGGGVIRSRCGGFGSENVFAVEAVQAGEMYVSVQTNGPRPVISFRASCAESSELSCASYSPDVPYAAVLTAYIPGPGTYLLAVDLEDGFGGSYILNAQFS